MTMLIVPYALLSIFILPAYDNLKLLNEVDQLFSITDASGFRVMIAKSEDKTLINGEFVEKRIMRRYLLIHRRCGTLTSILSRNNITIRGGDYF